MNQKTFLQQLAAGLTGLGEQERSSVLDYYRELICDGVENGKSEEAVIEEFDSPQDIAAQIRAEYRVPEPEQPAAAPEPPAAFGPHTYTARNPIGAVTVNAQNVSVEVQAVPDGPLRVLFSPGENDFVTVTEENGVFTFNHTMQHLLFHWRDLFRSPRSILLQVPASFHGDISVKTCNAKITASALHDVGSVNLVTGNARISVSDVDCHALQMKTSNGTLEAYGTRAQTCIGTTGNGRVTVKDCVFPARLQLRTSNGSLHAEQVTSDDFDFKTSNGPITGLLTGDAREYAIHSHTSNGQNNLPTDWSYPGQSKHLSAATSNARIHVDFTVPTV